MGEHTIREILKRRSPETQRAMQRRRELAQGGKPTSSLVPKLVVLVVILAILAYVGYLGWVASDAGKLFAAHKAERTRAGGGLTLAAAGEFLPNTLLASIDPEFYNPSGKSGAVLTRRLMHIYRPDASGLELRVMAVMVEARNPKTDIMESFINEVPMGGGTSAIKGLAAASDFYFSKPFAQLAPQDVALLVALIRDPDGLDPRSVPDKALEARNAVLLADEQQNVLAEAQVQALSKLPLDVTSAPAAQPVPAPAAATHPAH